MNEAVSEIPRGEDWFLEQLERDPPPVEELHRFLQGLSAAGEVAQATAWAELLEETLAARGLFTEVVSTLRLRASWPGASEESGAWEARVRSLIQGERDRESLVAHAGFGSDLPAAECFRRLDVLLKLKPGVLCWDNTWGFGVVQRVDTFYGRVHIDFERKADHSLSLAYAAQSLELLPEGHLLVEHHRNPEVIRRMAHEAPAELVKRALQSYGALTVTELQSKLCPRIVAEADWKSFWDNARAALRKDPQVSFPRKRTEPLRLLERPHAFDESWLQYVTGVRDLDELMDEIERYVREGLAAAPDLRPRLTERLDYLLRGASMNRPDIEVRATLAAERLEVEPYAQRIETWLRPDFYLERVRALPTRWIRAFHDALERKNRDAARELWLGALDQLPYPALSDVMGRLLGTDEETRCAELIRRSLAERRASIEILYWLSRNLERCASWNLPTRAELTWLTLDEMERGHSGERLKIRNQLRAQFEQPAWLTSLLEALSDAERRQLIQRIRNSRAWPALERQSLLGRIVKAYPELESELSGAAAAGAPRGPTRVTSWRSWRARQEQLQRLIEVDIPRISREIAQARSYGDLRENFEYKAAKEMQGILLRRRAEWENALHEVRPTDFSDFPSDRVGPGTRVRLKHDDGRESIWHILGEWDQDESLRIIASTTPLAQALMGRRPGEKIRLPSESGEVEIVAVEPLPPEVREWIGGA